MEESKKEDGSEDHRHRGSVHEDEGIQEVVGRVFHQQLDKELSWELYWRDALVETQGRCGSIAHQDLLVAVVWIPVPHTIDDNHKWDPLERHTNWMTIHLGSNFKKLYIASLYIESRHKNINRFYYETSRQKKMWSVCYAKEITEEPNLQPQARIGLCLR